MITYDNVKRVWLDRRLREAVDFFLHSTAAQRLPARGLHGLVSGLVRGNTS